jgi:4-amino-4-deoxy-L-arabinose transferase-like glycosyltransferase
VLVLSLVGTLHGLLYVPLIDKHSQTDSATYIAAARALGDASYTTPLFAGFYFVYPVGFFDLTGVQIDRRAWFADERQVFRPPGYPFALALVGDADGRSSRAATYVLQALLMGASIWLLAATVRRWWGPEPALLAAALYAFDPWSKHYVGLLLSEALSGFVVVACAYALTRAWQTGAPHWWAALGALTAALTLVRVVFVIAVPLALIAALVRRRLTGALALSIAAAVLLVPWLTWTGSVVGHPVLASYGEGYNLLVAAHGEGYGRTQGEIAASPAFLRDFRAPHRDAPSTSELLRDPTAHPRYVADADSQQRHAATALYRRRLADEPLQVLWENVYRMWFLWQAHEDWSQPSGSLLWILRALDWLLLALALAGAVLAARRGGAAAGVVVLVVVYTVALGIHHVEARFAMPLRGVYLALVALALLDGSRRLGRRADEEQPA